MVKNHNRAMISAANEAVKKCNAQGATDFNWSMIFAAIDGDIEAVKKQQSSRGNRLQLEYDFSGI